MKENEPGVSSQNQTFDLLGWFLSTTALKRCRFKNFWLPQLCINGSHGDVHVIRSLPLSHSLIGFPKLNFKSYTLRFWNSKQRNYRQFSRLTSLAKANANAKIPPPVFQRDKPRRLGILVQFNCVCNKREAAFKKPLFICINIYDVREKCSLQQQIFVNHAWRPIIYS